MGRVLGSRPVNGFWSSGLHCRCSGFSKANQCQLMSPLKAHLGSSPAPLLAELQPFAWLSHHLRWEENGLQPLMISLVLLDSKHKALKPSLAARRSLAHGSPSCSPRKKCFPHTCEHPRGTDGYVRATFDLAQNLGTAAPPPCCPRRRFPAQVFPVLGTAPTDMDWEVSREWSLKLQFLMSLQVLIALSSNPSTTGMVAWSEMKRSMYQNETTPLGNKVT